jgi:hypothetical protein
MYSNLTELKALWMSSLKRRTGIFALLNLVARFPSMQKVKNVLPPNKFKGLADVKLEEEGWDLCSLEYHNAPGFVPF